jgi:predicted ATPase
MKYRESKLDDDNRKWFGNDNTKQTLASIELCNGELRGLSPFKLEFKYPITAIAGKNGSGKSTLLGIAACGYHNIKSGFKFKWRTYTYYTFSDFFIQSIEEVSPQGISIDYGIRHNNWRITTDNPDKEGLKFQTRYKKKGGRWNDYSKRVKRDVVYFGIERVVPHSEKSVSKSYRNAFKKQQLYGWEENVKEIVGKILNKKYDNFEYAEYFKYRLPVVTSGSITYSGFNMGAGENALFEIFSTIYSCNEGALIVIDEIELGLHVEAQKKLIYQLKKLCNQRKIQIICTTHSKHIFEELPMDARIFIENIGGVTNITEKISSEFAFGKLAAVNSNELDIFVEDKTAFNLVNALLPNNIRSRINLGVIGSASALARQMASIRLRKEENCFLVIFDGDQTNNQKSIKSSYLKALENYDDKEKEVEWFDSKITFLPGQEWPEKWMLIESLKYVKELSVMTNSNPDELTDIIEAALLADKHSEFYDLSGLLNIGPEILLDRFSVILTLKSKDAFEDILSKINYMLP